LRGSPDFLLGVGLGQPPAALEERVEERAEGQVAVPELELVCVPVSHPQPYWPAAAVTCAVGGPLPALKAAWKEVDRTVPSCMSNHWHGWRIPPPRDTAEDDSGVAAVEFEEAEVVAAETEGP
jgi:hypothetical protein